MNVKVSSAYIHPEVLALIEAIAAEQHTSTYDGSIIYLTIVHKYIYAFASTDPNYTILQRITDLHICVCFIRFELLWIKERRKDDPTIQFRDAWFSSNCFKGIELSVLSFFKFASFCCEMHLPMLPWLLCSQMLEKTFRLIRSSDPSQVTMTKFTMLGI